LAENQTLLNAFQAEMGEIRMPVDGEERLAVGWPHWAATTKIDTADYWEQAARAVECHQSQQLDGSLYRRIAQKYDQSIWGHRTYYRAYSLVNGGREIETDLFAGLRAD
jgi:LmbE family N-acetylglucosaminyl deacetylase